ncbi:hypothetical protein [Mycolicibacterium phocaicum]|uniref:hypothetical protein n=1 Tax=Mycolicibacterium phocaicum TaxID=319706 RepID=UPI001CFA7C59|nr:hypothetical protein [Mycolicibacterium phocaicum]UCZ58652.1 hypothetical protein LHJ73_17915 [Mycolicibacterium phocaicum]
MATTTKLQDFLGRWLGNATPGTTQATDFLGRAVQAGDKDFAGRSLAFSNPSLWAQTTAYALNAYIRLSGGAILQATVGGTSVTGSEPAAPSVGGTVTDGTVTWKRIK